MREIKFKVWCKNKNEWETDLVLLDSYGNLIHRDQNGLDKMVFPETHIVVFYTGKKDKNSKEIYEKDILKNANGILSIVEWDNELCMFLQVIRSPAGKILDKLDFRFNSKEVVGSVLKNPELAEGENAGQPTSNAEGKGSLAEGSKEGT